MIRWLALCIPFLGSPLLASAVLARQDETRQYTNLQVLPADISQDELDEIMLENLRGLGLRRLAGEGCLHCHVGDLETPRSEWDYASDEKPAKATARAMMAMVREINDDHLGNLPSRIDRSFDVSCMTCHKGRLDPRPLTTILLEAYEDSGISDTESLYRGLYERYFGGDAYDFRVGSLISLSTHLASEGAIDDAIALAELNVEHHADSARAQQSLVALKLERVIDASGVEAALEALATMEPSLPDGTVNANLYGLVAWRLIRSDREDPGHALIEAAYLRYPGEYLALENMVFVFDRTDRREEAFALLESWLEEHPDHDRARRLLTNLRAEE